jgi:hypothetical protein
MLDIFDAILYTGASMVSKERLLNLHDKCSKFNNTNYSFVECGVARGGCLALMKSVAGKDNKVIGFDSFEGLPEIVEKDIDIYNKSDIFSFVGMNLSGGIENVYKTFKMLNLDMNNVSLIKGFLRKH